MSPISSRNSEPPSACSKRPLRCVAAPVKAPRSWPKNSDSIRSLGIAAVLTAMNDRAARGLFECRARATSSLPTPVSPVISTLMLEAASRPMARNTSCMAGASPINAVGRGAAATSSVPRGLRQARRTSATTASTSKGLGRYSKAPPR